jgi:DMSO/TMAO reductase YedYZ molybdopterin-dependent catalytic subunit
MNKPSKDAVPPRLSRRSALAAAGALTATSVLARVGRGDERGNAEAAVDPRMVVREFSPQNLESDFASSDSFLTPNEKFYVRNHFPMPTIDVNAWRLEVSGDGMSAHSWTYEQLLGKPSETKAVTLECAGNGRVLLVPKVDGAQWQYGAVGTAEWKGVSLASLLKTLKVPASIKDVILVGADSGEPGKPSRPAKPIPYARSVPIDRALNGGIMLAYEMNGKPLPPAHGYPLRAIVPGWYGMASVKWLSRIVLSEAPYQGYFQSVDYSFWQDVAGEPSRVPITELQIKSQIARPAMQEVVVAGAPYRVFGAAWSGDAAVTRVEVSTDGGKTFAPAELLGDAVPHAWRRWEYVWNVPSRGGRFELVSRATDHAGNVQPTERDRNRETYMINHLVPVLVEAVARGA